MRKLLILGRCGDKDRDLLIETVGTPNHIKSDISIINILALLTPLDICYYTAHIIFLLVLLKLNEI